MKPWMVTAYHHLPAPLRGLVATGRGYVLRRWRYPDLAALEDGVAAALEREAWSEMAWREWQGEQLVQQLHRAATTVPYYRRWWAGAIRPSNTTPWEELQRWPILKKETVRRQGWDFVAEGYPKRRLFPEHTSGTTGKPLSLWWSAEAVRAWYALFETRWRRWYGVATGDCWANLGGQLVVPVERQRPPFWVWNRVSKQLYMSSYHLAPQNLPHYLDALKHYRVRYLMGYPSALHELAEAALLAGRKDLAMTVVVTNAEPLLPHQLRSMEAAFGPTRETYGMAELVAAAGECEEGALHLWPEIGVVEEIDHELICTGLINKAMPLIRYRIGDQGRLAPPGETCLCGRTLPRLMAIEGRRDDLLLTPDGRSVGRLDPIFKADFPIRGAQIIQEALDRVRLCCIPVEGYSSATRDRLTSALRARLGSGMEIQIEEVQELQREANGKLRAVISRLSPQEHHGLAADH